MDWKNTKRGYGSLAIGFHWLMLALLVAVYATMEFKSVFPRGSAARTALASWHYVLGASVFALVWLRLLVRRLGVEPAIAPPLARWQALASKVVRRLLYALMIALPVLGWLTVSARGEPVFFFGAGLPLLGGIDTGLAGTFKEIHEALATAGYALVGVHALAALFHHYIKRDNTLTRMTCGR